MSNAPDFTIHCLGCGSAKPSLRHNPSSTVLDCRGNLFMIDCGEGAQRTFQQQRLKFSRLGHVFLTHLHGDHVFGLPGLIGTLALSGGGGSITIHTFEEGKRILTDIFDYFCRDTPFDIRFNVLSPAEETVIFENNAMTVRTIPLSHRVPTVGYVFEEKPGLAHINREMCDFHGVPISQMRAIKGGADFVKPDGTVIPHAMLTRPADPPRSYAHIGDTKYMPTLADKIRGVSLLYHETTYLESDKALAGPRGHSTALQAATVARDAGVGALLTGHYSSRYHDDALFAAEAKEVFPTVITGREGLRIPL
ncbi:MAG: ribonuclease Z [Muribaculaceae bacterium]|nr:ribonuclease Z [Muribaculaceae bacterium]